MNELDILLFVFVVYKALSLYKLGAEELSRETCQHFPAAIGTILVDTAANRRLKNYAPPSYCPDH